MKPLPQLKSVTGVTVVILALVAAVVYAVLFVPGSSDDLKTIVTQSILLALAACTGYWLNSSADQAKKDEPPAPSTTTTTVQIPADGESAESGTNGQQEPKAGP